MGEKGNVQNNATLHRRREYRLPAALRTVMLQRAAVSTWEKGRVAPNRMQNKTDYLSLPALKHVNG